MTNGYLLDELEGGYEIREESIRLVTSALPGVADGELLDAEAVDPERLGRRRDNRAAELRERARLELGLARL